VRKLGKIDLRIVGVREDKDWRYKAEYLVAEFTTVQNGLPVTTTIRVNPGAMTARQQETMIALSKMKRFIPYYAEVSYISGDHAIIDTPTFVRWRTAQDVARCAA
jgi:hypothetical protein